MRRPRDSGTAPEPTSPAVPALRLAGLVLAGAFATAYPFVNSSRSSTVSDGRNGFLFQTDPAGAIRDQAFTDETQWNEHVMRKTLRRSNLGMIATRRVLTGARV